MADLCYQCDGEGFAPMVNGHGGGNCPRCGGGGKERAVPLKAETKWTKGPWRAEGGDFVWTAADQMMVCEIRGWGHLTGVGGMRLSDDAAIAIQTANGHLIAAAPDLYAALEALQRRIVEADLWHGQEDELSAASAALAKARGEN